MIDLEDFVREATLKVLRAVTDARSKAPESAQVAPHDVVSQSEPALGVSSGASGELVSYLNFDIAVTASSEQSGKVGAGVKIPVVNAQFGASGETSGGSGQISRVAFTIPVVVSDPKAAFDQKARTERLNREAMARFDGTQL